MRDSRFVRYFGHQKKQGVGVFSAVINLPRNFYAYYSRGKGPGSMIQGYLRYDLPLLASYSRSGTNWIRYTLEYISQRPTPGQVRLYYGSNYVIDRAHQAYPVMDKYQNVVLIIRNYRECLLRNLEEVWQSNPNTVAFLENIEVFQQPGWYIKNIEAFDQFQGSKMLLYYEDLMTESDSSIRKLAGFIGLDKDRTEDYIANIETRKAESVEAYKRRGHESQTAGKQTNYHTKDKLTDEQAREFDEYYRSHYPELFEKYLKRYELPA
ncbi:MAG: sulfotransferase domain-containing protein [Chloroflexota bacterium]|jgi:hypothetical protein